MLQKLDSNIKQCISLGIRGLTTSPIVSNYMTSSHTELYSIYVQHIKHIYISRQYTYISIQCIYLFLMQ